jgi:hypothetical protein
LTDKAVSELLGAPLSAGPVKAWKQKEVKKSMDTRFQNMAGTTSRMAGCRGKISSDTELPCHLDAPIIP